MSDTSHILQALDVDCARECARIVAFIRDYASGAGFQRAVVNLSGGLDSALVAALAARALGPENVLALILPYKTSSPESEAHARLLIEQLGVRRDRFDITPLVDPLLARYPDMDARRTGNVMARCRMIVLYDQSVAFGGLALGTSNRTETLLGYFTLHGDAAAAIKPIAHLYKCQVRALSRHLQVPSVIVDKPPTADLWTGQTDEGELGFTYDQADAVLYLATQCGLGPDEIAAQGLSREIVEAILRRMAQTEFKRLPTPALSPVAGRCP